jgi:hypothetical protein
MPLFLTLIALLFTGLVAQAQLYWDDSTNKEYFIDHKTPEPLLNRFMEEEGIDKIEFNPDSNSVFTYRFKKGKHWGICHLDFLEIDNYDMEFPIAEIEGSGFTIASRKGRKYLHSLSNDYIREEDWFEKLIPYERRDTFEYFDEFEDAILPREVNNYLFAVKQKKWGVICLKPYEGGDFLKLTPMNYENEEDLPIDQLLELLGQEVHHEQYNFDTHSYLKEIHAALEYNNFDSVEFQTDVQYPYLRGKPKKGNWQLIGEGNDVIAFDRYDVQFSLETKCGPFNFATKDGKIYPYTMQLESRELHKDSWIDEFLPITKEVEDFYIRIDMDSESDNFGYEMLDTLGNFIFDTVRSITCNYVALRRGDKWALGYYAHTNNEAFPYQLSGFYYDNPSSLPDTLLNAYVMFQDEWGVPYDYEKMYATHEYLTRNEDVDLIQYFGTYQYDENSGIIKDIFKVRHAASGRWSLVIPSGFREDTQLPVGVDNIKEIESQQGKVLVVSCNNSLGLYYYDEYNIKRVTPCQFDDYKYLFLDSRYGMALKQDGIWQLYDETNGEKLVEGNAETLDGLIELWLNR